MRSLDVSLTEEQKAIVGKLRLEKRMSAKTIWKETGIPRHRIEAFLVASGPAMELRPYTEEQKLAAVKMKSIGKSCPDIAKELGLKLRAVRDLFQLLDLNRKQVIGVAKDKVISLFKSGFSVPRISDECGFSEASITRAIRSVGMEIKTRKSPLSESEKRAALAMYTPDIGVSEVARRLNISRHLVDKLLKSNGIKVFSNTEGRAIPKEDRERLEALYWQDGWTAEEIGRIYNTQSHIVLKFFRKNGVKVRSHGESVSFLGFKVEKEILDLYLAGESLSSLSRKFNRGEKTIRDKLVEKGVYKAPVKPNSVSDELRESARSMYLNDKMTIAQIVKRIPVNKAELTAYLVSIKISRRDRKFTPETCEKILEIYTGGQSIKYICRLFHCSPKIVRGLLTRRGIVIRESLDQIFKWNHKNYFISGFYRGVSFRSSTELSFLIGYLERFGLTYQSGECDKWSVPYNDPEGKSRTYYPDFVLPDKKLVIEIKPKAFWNNALIQAKKKAAENHFKSMGFRYQLVAYPILYDKIVERYLANEIVFHDDKKFRSHMLVQKNVHIDAMMPPKV